MMKIDNYNMKERITKDMPEVDFAVPLISDNSNRKKKSKKGWKIVLFVAIVVVLSFCIAKPYIVDYIDSLFDTLGPGCQLPVAN